MVVTMRAVEYCHPSHPDPKTLHRTPDCLSNRSCWSSPHQETPSAFLLQGNIHLLWWGKQHLPSTFSGRRASLRRFLVGFLFVCLFVFPEKSFLVVLHWPTSVKLQCFSWTSSTSVPNFAFSRAYKQYSSAEQSPGLLRALQTTVEENAGLQQISFH